MRSARVILTSALSTTKNRVSHRREKVVPLSLAPSSGLTEGRRRLGTLALVGGVIVTAYLAGVYAGGWWRTLGFSFAVALALLQFVTWFICRRARLSDQMAFSTAVVLAVLTAWFASVASHFGYEARVDRFTLAALCVFCAPFYALALGRVRIIAIATLMAVSQPVMAYAAYELGYARGSPRELFGSVSGALLSLALAIAASELIRATRKEVVRDIGGYRLERKLGAGGMGEVWEGRHRFLARPAAVKLLSASNPGPESTGRFRREAQATALLTSEHTVRLFDFGEMEDGRLYYVMEMLDGVDFEELVRENGPLEPAHVVSLMAQACDSLGEAHQAGIVHRDVKPSNLFLVRRGLEADFVKVLDFGLTTIAGGLTMTQADSQNFIGTAAYAPPELLRGEAPDAKSDVYQLGCVMFYLLTGRLVFDEKTIVACALAHANQAPPRLSEVATQPIPDDLERLITRCLSKQPEERPSSGAALAVELQALDCFGAWTARRAAQYFDSVRPSAELTEPGIADTLRQQSSHA